MTILYTNDIGSFFDQTLLQHVKRKNNVQVLSILNNSDPCQLSSSLGTTLLHFAAKYGNTQFAQHLIGLGAAIDARNRFAETPLMFAVNANQEGTVKLLLEANADPLASDISGQSALGNVLSNEKNFNDDIATQLLQKVTVESLEKNSEYIKNKQFHLDCKLYHFMSLKSPKVTRVLLETGSPVNAQSSRTGATALHLAVKQMDLDNVKLLLEFNADVNSKRRDGYTPLADIPAYKDQNKALSIAKILIAAGAVLIDGATREMMVNSLLMHGDRDIVRTLLQNQLDLQFKDECGRTVLHILALNTQPGVLKEVQDVELVTKVRTNDGCTTLHFAALAARMDNVEYLLDNGADINAQKKNGDTPLSSATSTYFPYEKYDEIFYDYLHCVDILLERGAYPQLCTNAYADFSSSEDKHVLLVEPVLAHLALLEGSGQPIEQSLHNKIESCPAYKLIFDVKKQELRKLKQIRIGQSVTLVDFLIASDKQISLFTRNQRLISNLSELIKEYNSKDLYYHRKLQKIFVKFIRLVEIRKKVAIAIDEVFKKSYNLSVVLIAQKIVNYLEDHELFKN